MAIKRLNTADTAQGGLFVEYATEVYNEVNRLIRDGGCVERFAKHIPMRSLQMRLPRFATGVDGYWVDAMAVKEKDKPTFTETVLTAEKMAVIVPFEDQLLEDVNVDLVGMIREDVAGAFTEALDATYMGYRAGPFGVSLSGSTPAANTVAFGDAGDDLAGDISLTIKKLEVNGFFPTGMIAHPGVKHELRNLRDANRQPIFHEDLSSSVPSYNVWGVPICFTRQVTCEGSPLVSEILFLYGPYVYIGERTGLQIAMSTEATLTQDQEDDINLFEQDMTAYRFVLRRAFNIKDTDAIAKLTDVPCGC